MESEGEVRSNWRGLWAEFLRNESVETSQTKRRGQRMKRMSEKWKNKMSGLVTVSTEYLQQLKKEHDEMKYLIAVKNAEIKDLQERLLYFESKVENGKENCCIED
jgi:hypothetical protein